MCVPTGSMQPPGPSTANTQQRQERHAHARVAGPSNIANLSGTLEDQLTPSEHSTRLKLIGVDVSKLVTEALLAVRCINSKLIAELIEVINRSLCCPLAVIKRRLRR